MLVKFLLFILDIFNILSAHFVYWLTLVKWTSVWTVEDVSLSGITFRPTGLSVLHAVGLSAQRH